MFIDLFDYVIDIFYKDDRGRLKKIDFKFWDDLKGRDIDV